MRNPKCFLQPLTSQKIRASFYRSFHKKRKKKKKTQNPQTQTIRKKKIKLKKKKEKPFECHISEIGLFSTMTSLSFSFFLISSAQIVWNVRERKKKWLLSFIETLTFFVLLIKRRFLFFIFFFFLLFSLFFFFQVIRKKKKFALCKNKNKKNFETSCEMFIAINSLPCVPHKEKKKTHINIQNILIVSYVLLNDF